MVLVYVVEPGNGMGMLFLWVVESRNWNGLVLGPCLKTGSGDLLLFQWGFEPTNGVYWCWFGDLRLGLKFCFCWLEDLYLGLGKGWFLCEWLNLGMDMWWCSCLSVWTWECSCNSVGLRVCTWEGDGILLVCVIEPGNGDGLMLAWGAETRNWNGLVFV